MIELYQVFLILGVLFYVVILTMLVIQKKINVRYSILWFTSASIMLLLAIFPEIVNRLAHLMGIAVPVNLLFVFHGLFLLLIALYLTSIVSWLTNRYPPRKSFSHSSSQFLASISR